MLKTKSEKMAKDVNTELGNLENVNIMDTTTFVIIILAILALIVLKGNNNNKQ